MIVSQTIKVGDSSIYVGEDPNDDNAMWSTNGPLLINSLPTDQGYVNEDVYIASQDSFARFHLGSMTVGTQPPPSYDENSTPEGARMFLLSPIENALCAGTGHPLGTVYCARVQSSTAKFFSGTMLTQVPGTEQMYIGGDGDYHTTGEIYAGDMTDNSNPGNFNFISNRSVSTDNGFVSVNTNSGGIAFKSIYETGGIEYGIEVTNGGRFSLKSTNDNRVEMGSHSASAPQLEVYEGPLSNFAVYPSGKVNLQELIINPRNTSNGVRTISIQQNNVENFKVTNEGYVYAREIEVKTGSFPDYVFEDDYALMPIDELKAYIEENGHLPGAPAAEEVIAENLKLKEMNLLLMEKVEELTLYMIQLNEKIEAK